MSNKSPGGIRPSQLITTYGPGSLVDFKDDSVMIMGLQDWKEQEGYYKKIYEPRLSTKLNVSYFLQPRSVNRRGGVPAISFPKYRVCSKCGALRNDFKWDYKGYFCNCNGKKAETYPARLIVACEQGHIDDFPWVSWCHRGQENICGSPDLYLVTQGRSSSLDDVVIMCKGCKKGKNTLAGALKRDTLKSIVGTCSGNSPWKREKVQGCSSTPRGLQRGASNVYFSSTISALSIPPWTDEIQEIVSEKWTIIKKNIEKKGLSGVEAVLDIIFPDFDEEGLTKIFKAVKNQYKMEENPTDIRYEEWQAFQDKENKTKHFYIEEEEVDPSISPFISRVVLTHRLREIRVLRGFTRIDYPDPYADNDVAYSYLSSDRELDWLPGAELLGEGIFVQLDESKLREWEGNEAVKQRYKKLLKRYQNQREEKNWKRDERFSERFILLHTLSHLLIRELSLSCGYSSNSIREKIYSGPDMCGILLYTGSPDSDGSLGGIIQQGRKDQFHNLLKQAIERGKICSSDPLCSESENIVENKFNLSACHACSLVSETSCEWSNLLLDRLALFKTEENSTGFFEF